MGAGQSIAEGKAPGRALEPFFDFIVGYESDSVSHSRQSLEDIETHDFEEFVEQHEGRTLDLIVWSSKAQAIRSKA